MSTCAQVIGAVVGETQAGRAVALCAIVATEGSTPQPAGSILAVLASGESVGTLGGGCVEGDVIRRAHALIADGGSRVLSFHLDHNSSDYSGLICGGSMDVAIMVLNEPSQSTPFVRALENLGTGHSAELPIRVHTDDGEMEYHVRIEAAPKLVIAGGGHVSRILASLALSIGFQVTVVDDREKYANAERFPSPMTAVAGNIQRILASWPIDSSTYIVIVTRGHRQDMHALKAVLDSAAKYIGMIGSRRKIETIYDDLRQGGATDEQLERVRAPIGIDINAVTTEEIALSIAAELIAVRRKDHHSTVEGPLPIAEGSS